MDLRILPTAGRQPDVARAWRLSTHSAMRVNPARYAQLAPNKSIAEQTRQDAPVTVQQDEAEIRADRAGWRTPGVWRGGDAAR